MSENILIIVESPSKISLIEKYLEERYSVLATRGHICDIEGIKNINIKDDFETKYSIIESKRTNVENMRKTITQYKHENIYIGTDNDVEGEKIAFDVCEVFSLPLKNTRRLRFNEITETALKSSIKNPTHIDMNIVRSQQTRQILDILIGYKISPLLWKYINHLKSDTFSAGRCQSSALALIYDNNELSKSKKICKSFKTKGFFLSYPFTIECGLSKDFDDVNDVREFLTLSKVFDHTISVGSKYESSKSPPQPLNTSGMIQMSSNLLKISPKTTMKLAQQLYQEGRITYIRTESIKYSHDFLEKMEKFLINKFDIKFIGDLEKISNLKSSLPHEAIRVTDLNVVSVEGDIKLKKLYKEIYKNTVVSCMATAKYNSYDLKISAPQNLEYAKRIDVSVFEGWTKYDNSESHKDIIKYIEHLKSKVVNYQSISSDINLSSNHTHYSETSLIKKLEQLGIGRPSTYTCFIEKNLERGYVKKRNIDGLVESCVSFKLESSVLTESTNEKTFCDEKEKLVINETGIKCIEFLRKNFRDIFDYSYTKTMEKN
jgi:DNA topoisomerase I